MTEIASMSMSMSMSTSTPAESVYEPREGEHRISTSERADFKRCRRRWDWKYRNQLILDDEDEARSALFFGTGFHFALEDYHGYQRYAHPADAFDAYVHAFIKSGSEPPLMIDDLSRLAVGMLDHYTNFWLPRRRDFKTLYVNGVPQVELPFEIPLNVRCNCYEHNVGDTNHTATSGGVGWPIIYVGTFDRVVEDPYGRIWIQDYKSCARFDTSKLDLDAQITAYCWAGKQIYGDKFQGVLYTQFRKAIPDYPRQLKSGDFSMDKSQKTTYALYVEALKSAYGGVPSKYNEFLNHLAALEDENGDAFIRQDMVSRNDYEIAAEDDAIYREVAEMFREYIPIFKTATNDCTWDCAFRDPCTATDRGTEPYWRFEEKIKNTRKQSSQWRTNLAPSQPPHPDSVQV